MEPIRRIELEHAKPTKLRIALIVLAIVVAAAAFASGINALLSQSSGWQSVEAYPDGIDCSGDFALEYFFDAGGASDTVTSKTLSALYTQALEEACAAFYPQGELARLNAIPNEVLEVGDVLYRALEQIVQSGNRSIYLAPVYALYDQIFLWEDETLARQYDPMYNEELGAYAAELAAFANDPTQIDLELLGEGQVRLNISDDYLAYAAENGVEEFLDFGWMTNAFITDHVADTLAQRGYTAGYIASFDGFTRNLGGSGMSYAQNLFDRVESEIRRPVALNYAGEMSIVALRDYPMSGADRWHYASYSDGGITTAFISPETGRSQSAVHDLTAYSQQAGCVEVLLSIAPVFLARELESAALEALAADGIDSVWFADGALCHTGEEDSFVLTEDGTSMGYRIS